MPAGIVAILSTFNEEDIIAQVIRHLIDQRVSLYAIDNWSTDRTVSEIEPFLGRGVIGIERFPPDRDSQSNRYEWRRILERKAELARTLDASWFIHHDADEIRESPWADLDLAAAIERVDRFGYNAIDFEQLDFWPTDDSFTPGKDIRSTFTHYEPAKEFDRVRVNAWKKTGAVVDIASSGGHDAIFPGRKVFPIRFILRHYPVRSQAHGVRKIFQERLPRYTPEERRQGWHIQYQALQPTQSFIRDPSTLTRYDPDRIRLNLCLHHRGVEELENRPDVEQRLIAHEKRYAARLERELDQQNHEAARLSLDLDHRNREVERLRMELDRQNQGVEHLRMELDRQNQGVEHLRMELDRQNQEVERLRMELDHQNHEIVGVHRALHDRNLEIEALNRAVHARDLDIEKLQRRIEAICSTWTWRAAELVRRALGRRVDQH